MNECNGDRKCLNLCDCTCYNDDTNEYNEICTCGHREHNGICIYVHCECTCNIYDEKSDEYIDIACTCGHREHNGNCYLAEPTCCEPIKCLNYNICKFICLEEYEIPKSPFCIECDCNMGKFKNTKIIKYCDICFENKNILLLECNHEICSECWISYCNENIKNNSFIFNCPFCRNNTAN